MNRIRRVFARIGRRGSSLLFFATILLVLGQSYFTSPVTPAGREQLWAHLQFVPLTAWGVAWIVGGLVCIAGALYKRFEPWAFAFATTLIAMWAVGFFISWVTGHGYRSYVGFIIWAAFSAFILLISGWPEGKDYGVEQ